MRKWRREKENPTTLFLIPMCPLGADAICTYQGIERDQYSCRPNPCTPFSVRDVQRGVWCGRPRWTSPTRRRRKPGAKKTADRKAGPPSAGPSTLKPLSPSFRRLGKTGRVVRPWLRTEIGTASVRGLFIDVLIQHSVAPGHMPVTGSAPLRAEQILKYICYCR